MEDHPTATETPESSRKVATVRRNPIRKARVSNLWICNDNISPSNLPHNRPQIPSSSPSPSQSSNRISDNLRVFLRIRPSLSRNQSPAPRRGRTGPHQKKIQECVYINDEQSVTVTAPATEQKRRRSTEVFGGFAFVFSGDSSQKDVFHKMAMPLVDEFLCGRSGMIVALGPTGSGKTHTVFGHRGDPGVLSLALRGVLRRDGTDGSDLRISMFEICSERGRGERMVDLIGDGAELSMQQWTVKGLKEIRVSGVAEAEAAVEGGRMRRSTAATNSNCISSRSQCIISIRNAINGAMFTIADLAGSEKQKRTGNNGARLAESGFINNTLMVFGQCLRALLEHQKNPGKPLHKHCHNSMLTKYLRDYLEGRKRMVLILTVKPGEDDYPDTSSLLRQASPLMKITFRPPDPFPRPPPLTKRRQISGPSVAELPKRMKITSAEAEEKNSSGCAICEEKERENKVMRKLTRSLLTLSRKYKERAEVEKKESLSFQIRLKEEEARNSELVCLLEDMKANIQRADERVTNEAPLFSNGGDTIDRTEEILIREDEMKENLKGEEILEESKWESKKPKRRLAPAASLLVKGVDGFGPDDRGRERPKRSPAKNTTLLRLLRPNLYH